MAYPLGRGVRLEVQNVVGTAKTISAITLASPGVATSTAHGLTAGTVGFISGISGMVQLEGQAIRVTAPSTNDFTLQKVKTTDYAAMTGTCSFFPITSWNTIGSATSVQVGGGDSADVDQTTLIDDLTQLSAGLLAAQTVSVSQFSNFESAAMLKVAEAALDQTDLVFRLTLKDGQQRVWRGTPSLPGEDMSVGATGTGQFSIKVVGRVIFLPAV
jgi:hypothetical protein